MTGVTKSVRWSLLLAIALVALVVRLVYIWQISHAPFFELRLGDAASYHQWALRIAGGDWRGEGVFYQAPLYPYFLAVIYRVVGDGAAMVRFIQAVVGAGSCVLLAAAGIELFGIWGAAAGVLLTIYPPAIFLDGLLEKSTLVTFFTAALLYVLSAPRARWRALLAGVVLGLLALTRENALLLAIPLLAWFAISDGSPQRLTSSSGITAAAFLAGCVLILLPVGVRNYVVGGEFHLTTSQFGPNFYIGNHDGAQGLYEPLVDNRGNAEAEAEDATRIAEAASHRTLRPNEVSSFWTARALDFIAAHPVAWLGQLARKLALTYNATEIADTESQQVYAEWSPILRFLAPFSFGVIFCVAAFGLCVTAGEWRRLWFLYAIALTYTFSVVIFYVFARYRFPLVPVLMLLAVGGLTALRQRPSPLKRYWAIGALLLAGVVAFLPLVNTRIDRISHYVNIANAFLQDSATWDQSADFYDKALDESPKSPAANFGMGMLLALKHQSADAIPRYRTAVEGWPDNADVRLNLALALSDVGDLQGALEQLNAATRLRPGDLTPVLLEGKLLLNQSRPSDALQAYERALVIDPKNADALIGSGFALTQLKRPDEAIARYRRALQVNPQDVDAHKSLGWTLRANGRLAEAKQEFEQALSINPSDQDARSALERLNPSR